MRLIISIALLLVLTGAGQAATLRPITTLHAATVRLSDLFDDAGPRATQALGPGPGPGGRIVVEAPQLAAIARQFGVDWVPASSGDRAVLDRPGRPLPREGVLAALHEALTGAGAGPDCDIDLAGFNPPLIPFEAKAIPVISQIEYDAASGRFSALLSVSAAEMDPLNLRIAGHAEETVQVPVATTRLVIGAVVLPTDLRIGRLHAGLIHGAVATRTDQAIGLALRHPVMPGQPLPLADLAAPVMVARGATVLIQLDSPGIALTAQGQAMEDGAMGARIHVLNPLSRAVLEADVTGPQRVRVDAASIPVVPQTRGAPALQVSP